MLMNTSNFAKILITFRDFIKIKAEKNIGSNDKYFQKNIMLLMFSLIKGHPSLFSIAKPFPISTYVIDKELIF